MNAQSLLLVLGRSIHSSTAHFCCRVKGGWNIEGGQDVESRKQLKVIFVLGMQTKRKKDEMFGNRTGRSQEADTRWQKECTRIDNQQAQRIPYK